WYLTFWILPAWPQLLPWLSRCSPESGSGLQFFSRMFLLTWFACASIRSVCLPWAAALRWERLLQLSYCLLCFTCCSVRILTKIRRFTAEGRFRWLSNFIGFFVTAAHFALPPQVFCDICCRHVKIRTKVLLPA